MPKAIKNMSFTFLTLSVVDLKFRVFTFFILFMFASNVHLLPKGRMMLLYVIYFLVGVLTCDDMGLLPDT